MAIWFEAMNLKLKSPGPTELILLKTVGSFCSISRCVVEYAEIDVFIHFSSVTINFYKELRFAKYQNLRTYREPINTVSYDWFKCLDH